MIGKVTRGSDTAGLLRYLFGPGRANEHTDPRVVAAWDEHTQALEPAVVNGRHDIRTLAGLLDQPLAALPRRPATTVWQCSLRTAPGDRRLTDAEWADAAREVLDRTGLAPRGDEGACRWVAVRHADDHIHLAVTLARQDGRPAHASHDFHRVGEACRETERRYGLTVTAPRDGSAPRRPTRGELEKARRHHRQETPRETLRREVRVAAASAHDTSGFLAQLRAQGVMVKERYSDQEPGQVTGYAVAWPGDRNGAGDQAIWFSGSKLVPDLSLPQLTGRWQAQNHTPVQHPSHGATSSVRQAAPADSAGAAPSPRQAWGDAARAAEQAAAGLRALSRSDGDTASDVAHATLDLLVAAARACEGLRGGPLTQAADTFQRVRHSRPTQTPWTSPSAAAMFASARQIAHLGRPPDDAVSELCQSLIALTTAVSRLRTAAGHSAQAAAARDAAAVLHGAAVRPTTHRTAEAAATKRRPSPEMRHPFQARL